MSRGKVFIQQRERTRKNGNEIQCVKRGCKEEFGVEDAVLEAVLLVTRDGLLESKLEVCFLLILMTNRRRIFKFKKLHLKRFEENEMNSSDRN